MKKLFKNPLLLLGAAAAGLYFLNKNSQQPKEAIKTGEVIKSGEVKKLAVNTPVTTVTQARPAMFNPVNNALNNVTNIFPRKKAVKALTRKSVTDERVGSVHNVIL